MSATRFLIMFSSGVVPNLATKDTDQFIDLARGLCQAGRLCLAFLDEWLTPW
jgi:hypothetical protein